MGQRYDDHTRQTERDAERERLRPFLRQYLEGCGIDTSKNFRCLSPDHPDRHPSAYYTTGNRALCRACGARYDIFDVIALEMGTTSADPRVFDEVRRRYGGGNFSFSQAAAQPPSSSGGNSPQCLGWNDTIQAEPAPAPEPPADYSDFFRECAARITATDYPQRRGLTAETCARFGLGYAPTWHHPKSRVHSPRLIIPTSRSSYHARDVRPENKIPEYQRKYIKQQVGKVNLYLQSNLYKRGAACVIVEGELDALSIMQSGGTACALRSIQQKPQFLRIVESKPPAVPLYLLLDADDDGQRAQRELANDLDRLRIAYAVGTLPTGCKDANDALRICPDYLEKLAWSLEI